ncbi:MULTISPECIES: YncE family protein [Methylobacterium]|uniref:Hydrazine synthase subunit beta n=1 Tax=Methylobacterium thuringiense TaxID=1003091 RepID=A0ABQ4TF86_9HYPH|nr:MULTISPECIES: YncE family protein [Methylobacterium]TXN22567.1 YncE family protein [Methylobacterium sp. WL9]GJE54044.1 Hydrazine synthase subunit beta [Methylobacterium thuringiense]
MSHRLGLPLFFLTVLLTAVPTFAQEAYVTAQLAGEVAVVDLGQAKVIAHIPLDGAPAGIALSPDRRTAYVTRPEGQSVAVLDLDARKVTASLAVPGGPLGICVDPQTGTVYVADWYASRVFVLAPAPEGLKQTGEIAVGKSPSGLAVTPDGRSLLVANREADSVSVVDLATARESQKIAVGQHPFGLTLSADGRRAYTANVTSNDVSVIDVAARREIGRVKTGDRPYVVALAGGRGFVTDQYSNTVTAFGLDDLKPAGTIDVEDHPEGIAAAKDGKTLYVANWGDNSLSVIDAGTLKVTGKIAVPDGPRAFGDFLR